MQLGYNTTIGVLEQPLFTRVNSYFPLRTLCETSSFTSHSSIISKQ